MLTAKQQEKEKCYANPLIIHNTASLSIPAEPHSWARQWAR